MILYNITAYFSPLKFEAVKLLHKMAGTCRNFQEAFKYVKTTVYLISEEAGNICQKLH